jgi:hypothetical protein
MSRPNFKKIHARDYYVCGDADWDEVDYDVYFDALRDETPGILKEYLEPGALGSEEYGTRNCLPVKDWETFVWRNHDYGASLLASARIFPDEFLMPYTKTKIECSVIMNIYLVSGAYVGANLDWDLGFRYEETKMLSEYETKKELIGDVADYIFQDLEYYENDKETPRKRIALKNWLSKIFDEYANKADEYCKTHCTQILKCVGIASNGEATYSAA